MLTGEKFKKANATAEKARKLKSILKWINQKTRCGKWKCGKYLVPNELLSLKLAKKQPNSLNVFFSRCSIIGVRQFSSFSERNYLIITYYPVLYLLQLMLWFTHFSLEFSFCALASTFHS